jgi:hypothetical protein
MQVLFVAAAHLLTVLGRIDACISSSDISVQHQGDQIGRIFAQWAIVSIVQFFRKKYGRTTSFGATLSQGKSFNYFN